VELTARDAQLDRHEEWIERTSGKLKIGYDPTP